MTRISLIISIAFLWIETVCCTHFRGGIFYWTPVSKVPSPTINVSIVQSYSWVRSYEFCDSVTIATRGLIGSNSTPLQCISGCGNNGGYCDCITTDVVCTDYSITQDLSSGQKVSYVSITQNARFYLTFQNSNWSPLATASSASWSITSLVNLVVRSDNGLINSPPVVSVLPIIHLPVSVQSTVNLLVTDADNDYIQCRWARLGGVDECGGVCQAVTGALLLSNCSLIFTPTIPQIYYAAAIMVEDFYSNTSTLVPLSSTPVQFLIHTYSSPTSCSTKPVIIGPYPDQSCIDVKVGIPFTITLTAEIGCTGTAITDFNTVSPVGMVKSSSIIAVNSKIYSLSFTWTPTLEQIGSQIFCVAAIGTFNIQSSQVCYRLVVSLVSSANTCPPLTTVLIPIDTTLSTEIDQDDYIRYVFLVVGIITGFLCAMLAMWAIHFFLNRQICCLKPKNKYEPTSSAILNRSTMSNSRQAFA
ncbi:hypothetical protein I4U23_007946 [Adineta vaga]|nr:hypothetical protein I4U23_007946 [Adineta vaga]